MMMSLKINNFWQQEIKNNNNVQSVSITLIVPSSLSIMTPVAGQKTNIKSNNFLFRTVTHLLICNHFLRHKICSGEVNKFK